MLAALWRSSKAQAWVCSWLRAAAAGLCQTLLHVVILTVFSSKHALLRHSALSVQHDMLVHVCRHPATCTAAFASSVTCSRQNGPQWHSARGCLTQPPPRWLTGLPWLEGWSLSSRSSEIWSTLRWLQTVACSEVLWCAWLRELQVCQSTHCSNTCSKRQGTSAAVLDNSCL